MRKTNKNANKRLPKWAKFLFLIAIISGIVHFIGTKNSAFAEWLTQNVGFLIRRALAYLTSGISVSLAEILIILSPLILVIVLVMASRRKGFCSKMSFLACLLAVISIFYSGYVYTLGIGYHRTSLSSRIQLGDVTVNEDNLYQTLLILKNECESLIPEIEYKASGSSVSDISFDEICDEVLVGYERLDKDFPSLDIKTFDSRAKAVKFSKVMTKLDLLGVYTYFTGESNVNVHYPDYNIPFTVAHELAHQRGISRENEANFVAFLVCIRSENAYVRYSGYMNMFEYVAAALARTNRELRNEVFRSLDEKMYGEMRAYSEFYQENKNEILGKLSEFVNDNYLKAQGTEGVVSYGLVVELCVAYYSNRG